MSNDLAVRFGASALECAALAAFLAEAAEDHLGVLPDDVDWSWLGTIGKLRGELISAVASLPGGGGRAAAASVVADYFGESVAWGDEVCEGAADDPDNYGDDLVTAVFAKYGSAQFVR